MGATYGYQSLIAYFPKLEAAIAVGTSLETDTQQHPADTLCFAYNKAVDVVYGCLLYTSPSPRDRTRSRMPSSA